MEVKICGITRLKDALACIEAKVDALGFIFYEQSPRYIAPPAAAELVGRLPDTTVTVGVFVDMPADLITKIVRLVGLDMIQLHGRESPDDCRAFEKDRLIKAIFPPDSSYPPEEYPVRALLVDRRTAKLPGGTGEQSDWDFAAREARRHRIILAGGLNRENITEAMAQVNPRAVDVNSGVELAPGIKDPRKIEALMDIISNSDCPEWDDGRCFVKKC